MLPSLGGLSLHHAEAPTGGPLRFQHEKNRWDGIVIKLAQATGGFKADALAGRDQEFVQELQKLYWLLVRGTQDQKEATVLLLAHINNQWSQRQSGEVLLDAYLDGTRGNQPLNFFTAIVSLMGGENQLDTRYAAAQSASALTRYGESVVQALKSANVGPPAVALLNNSSTQQIAAKLLAAIDCTEDIVQYGGLPPLVAMTREAASHPNWVTNNTMTILRRMIGEDGAPSNETFSALVEQGVLGAAIAIFENSVRDYSHVRPQGLEAGALLRDIFDRMSQYPDVNTVEKIIEARIVETLLAMLSRLGAVSPDGRSILIILKLLLMLAGPDGNNRPLQDNELMDHMLSARTVEIVTANVLRIPRQLRLEEHDKTFLILNLLLRHDNRWARSFLDLGGFDYLFTLATLENFAAQEDDEPGVTHRYLSIVANLVAADTHVRDVAVQKAINLSPQRRMDVLEAWMSRWAPKRGDTVNVYELNWEYKNGFQAFLGHGRVYDLLTEIYTHVYPMTGPLAKGQLAPKLWRVALTTTERARYANWDWDRIGEAMNDVKVLTEAAVSNPQPYVIAALKLVHHIQQELDNDFKKLAQYDYRADDVTWEQIEALRKRVEEVNNERYLDKGVPELGLALIAKLREMEQTHAMQDERRRAHVFTEAQLQEREQRLHWRDKLLPKLKELYKDNQQFAAQLTREIDKAMSMLYNPEPGNVLFEWDKRHPFGADEMDTTAFAGQ